ncbi:uncharacterized protein PHACADRAFT_253286 [Phanerochaete carnosa HHB-10118-sp]|uniref:Uncharacterized protein n=1 Tax=Phanerochaete carnosa (strain HHB-10118-sp) TaxID=650164 RepID=K5WAL7_PHACS|nr:uncharacterized protein PHACADRAFT_253286 [Phanerochaete carnosa HHB-10118-sp]EKM56255.1 hypothetical protein PHACADRAFT_253286 [Phanerochaete carnosa HHB-10118-sp]
MTSHALTEDATALGARANCHGVVACTQPIIRIHEETDASKLYFYEDVTLEPADVMDQAWSIRRRIATLGPAIPITRCLCEPDRYGDDELFLLDMVPDTNMALRPQPSIRVPEPCADCAVVSAHVSVS